MLLGDQIEKNEMFGNEARLWESIYVYRVWWVNLRERNRLVEPNLDGRIIFKRTFKKWDVGHEPD